MSGERDRQERQRRRDRDAETQESSTDTAHALGNSELTEERRKQGRQ